MSKPQQASSAAANTPTFHYVFANSNFPSSLEIDDACQKLRTMALALYAEAKVQLNSEQQQEQQEQQHKQQQPNPEHHHPHFTIPNPQFFDLYLHALDMLAFCFIYAGHQLRDVTVAFDANHLPTYKEMLTADYEQLVKDAISHNAIKKKHGKTYALLGLAYLHFIVCKLENNNKQEYQNALQLVKEVVTQNFTKKKLASPSPFKPEEVISEDEKTHIANVRLTNPSASPAFNASGTFYTIPILKDWMNSELKIKAQIMALRVWLSLMPHNFEDFSDEHAIQLLFEFEELDKYNPYMHHAKAIYIHTVHREELNQAIQHYFMAGPNYPIGELQKVNVWATLGWVCELGHPTEKDFPGLYKFAKQALEAYNDCYKQDIDYTQYVTDLKRLKLGKNVQRRLNKCFKCAAKDVHLKACSACKWALYCGGECQKLDWVEHKQLCKKITSKEAEVHTEKIEGSIVYYLAEDWQPAAKQ